MKDEEWNLNYYKEKSRQIRNDILDMCYSAGTGHVTSSFSCTEILVALYYKIMSHNPKDPNWEDRDRFILSKGQSSVIMYPLLADLGYFPKEWLNTFCKKDGKFGVHLQKNVPGVEITAGSLGHGFGIAAGMALAAKMDNKKHLIYALLGDGELYEGSIWETVMFISHHKLNNLITIIDRNWQCATDFTEHCIKLEPLEDKFESFGCRVIRIDGHNFEEIFNALESKNISQNNKPLVIIANTLKGKGVDFMEDKSMWHSRSPNKEEYSIAKKQLEKTL